MAKKQGLPVATSKKPIPVKIVNDAPSPSKWADEDKKYRAESDLRTLQEAGKIQKDKERMKAAKSCAKEQMKALSHVTGK